MSESSDNLIPEKKQKQDVFTRTGYFAFPSAAVAKMVYNSFAYDEDAPRSKAERVLEIDENRIKFLITANSEKSLGKSVDSVTACINLSQEVLHMGSKFGGQLSEEERIGISKPVQRIFT